MFSVVLLLLVANVSSLVVRMGMFTCDSEMNEVSLWSGNYNKIVEKEASCDLFNYCDIGTATSYNYIKNVNEPYVNLWFDAEIESRDSFHLKYNLETLEPCNSDVFLLVSNNTIKLDHDAMTMIHDDLKLKSNYVYELTLVNRNKCRIAFELLTTIDRAGCGYYGNRKLEDEAKQKEAKKERVKESQLRQRHANGY